MNPVYFLKFWTSKNSAVTLFLAKSTLPMSRVR